MHGDTTRWIELVDPGEDELVGHLPDAIHATALAALLAPHEHSDEPRPRIDSHDEYVLGIFLLPVAVTAEDRVYYQEVDFVATHDKLTTSPSSAGCGATGGRGAGSSGRRSSSSRSSAGSAGCRPLATLPRPCPITSARNARSGRSTTTAARDSPARRRRATTVGSGFSSNCSTTTTQLPTPASW